MPDFIRNFDKWLTEKNWKYKNRWILPFKPISKKGFEMHFERWKNEELFVYQQWCIVLNLINLLRWEGWTKFQFLISIFFFNLTKMHVELRLHICIVTIMYFATSRLFERVLLNYKIILNFYYCLDKLLDVSILDDLHIS